MSQIAPSIEDLLPDKAKVEGSAQAKLQQKMQKINIKEKETETEQKATQLGLSYINLEGFGISPETLTTIEEARSKELQAICFLNTGKEIRLGAVNFNDQILTLEQELKEKYFADVETYLISQHSFDSAFKLYAALPKIRKFTRGIEIKEEDLEKFGDEIKKTQGFK